jgi:hypothetical protein
MKIMFVDESGDHNLAVIDPQYPMFVLAGVIMDQAYAQGYLEHRFAGFKQDLFGRTDIILHRADITRNRNGFERIEEAAFLNLKIQGTQYVDAAQIERRIAGLSLRAKTDNIAGLQLADLVATPIGRGLLAKKDLQDYNVIRSKFRTNRRGEYRGFGLIVLPRKPKN